MSISEQQHSIETGFGSKSEASEVMSGIDLSGKVALVTGGYSGIGFETVRALTGAGAKVIVPSRDVDRAVTTLDGVIGAEQIGFMDLSDLPSVTRFGEAIAANHPKIDIAIFNAGVMACPLYRTQQGLEWQLGVNHVGHYVLLQTLLPALRAARGARLVTLSSIAHRMSAVRFDDMNYTDREYDKWQAYGQAKSAQSLMAVELDRREAGNGIRGFSVHPGGIFTPLQRHLGNAEMAEFGWTDTDGRPSPVAEKLFKTTTQGCATSLWAATHSLLDNIGGVYCEDCNVSDVVPDESNAFTGVRQWAIDSETAQRTWTETEALISRL
ncbi:SDR family NAD(P)-dependent oxidoreductase [Candidatus Paraluminiphilus aquimaris]|uniref:SDR family NAD(P)-dependent oxidoreductase n=1 Tax=Candidatus Paraluminiphilus aquimaris TaxID=2518994 RepID=A0ABY6Q4Q9_9GAMM|nr:oxidoreductase [Candidatus Paraluminiphilus aquimaris]UZP73505.1 SDR family NAD(P)-dependent oxidoreductase [Candidatus Paraluminiphilus aquimaris]